VQNHRVIEHFIARLEILPFTDKAAAHYGEIRAQLERVGRPAGAYDMLIGGHARSEGLVLVTRNLREFELMAGLRLDHWG
jgi:tRNA(fMet)-specific endonuclease VapC